MTADREYKILLLDADNTFFDFDRCERDALRDTLVNFGIPFDGDILARYHAFNDSLWKKVEKGTLSRSDLRRDRFTLFMGEIGRGDLVPTGGDIGEFFVASLSRYAYFIYGMDDACRKLAKKYRMYIVTNGITSVQNSRFEIAGIAEFFDGVFISESLGCAKPAREFFDAVVAKTGALPKSDYLIIGDSLTSDIAGGVNAGIDTCLFDRENRDIPQPQQPAYVVHSPKELLELLL